MEIGLGTPLHHEIHELLIEKMVSLDSDFKPYGKRERDIIADCSCGCKHFVLLEGCLGMDWGVCINKDSPRCGMLTFEHQGCEQYEDEEID